MFLRSLAFVCVAQRFGCTTGAPPDVNGTVVAALFGAYPTAWSAASPCLYSDIARVRCNLDTYSMAVSAAASAGAQIIVLPEGYGTSGIPTSATFFEPMAAVVGKSLCSNATVASLSPQQYRMSCDAQNNHIAVAANFFVALPNGTHRIQEVVYDDKGVVVATYAKIRVIPFVESSFASSGPFLPTTFELLGRRWGILICNDGVYPYITGDWSELDALKKQGADTILWSVGMDVPIAHLSARTAKTYGWNVIASEIPSVVTGTLSASIVGVDGATFPSQQDIAFHAPQDYTKGSELHVRLATFPPAQRAELVSV